MMTPCNNNNKNNSTTLEMNLGVHSPITIIPTQMNDDKSISFNDNNQLEGRDHLLPTHHNFTPMETMTLDKEDLATKFLCLLATSYKNDRNEVLADSNTRTVITKTIARKNSSSVLYNEIPINRYLGGCNIENKPSLPLESAHTNDNNNNENIGNIITTSMEHYGASLILPATSIHLAQMANTSNDWVT